MNKVLSVACVVGLVATFAAASHASEDTWTIQFKGGSAAEITGGIPGGTIVTNSLIDNYGIVQAKSSTLSGVADAEKGAGTKDNYDGGYNPITGAPVMVGWYRPDWDSGSLDVPWLSLIDTKTPLATASNKVKTWGDMLVWAKTGYSGNQIHLYVQASTGAQLPPDSVGGQTVRYKLVLTYAPAGYSGQTEWLLPLMGSTGKIMADVVLPIAGAVGNTPFDANKNQVLGYRFNLVTPEPGSVLALGAGLVSFIGMIRRRSA